MIAGFEEGAQDCIPLFRVLEPNPLQVAVKDFLGFAHGFAGRRRMIINPSLQHDLRARENHLPIMKMKFIFIISGTVHGS